MRTLRFLTIIGAAFAVAVAAAGVMTGWAAGAGPGANPPAPAVKPHAGAGAPTKSAGGRGPSALPSRLWYRVELRVTDRRTMHGPEIDIVWTDGWYVRSNTAVIVEAFCLRRATGERVAYGRCAHAFAGRRRPGGLVDDLSFNANGKGILSSFVWQQKEAAMPAWQQDGGREVKCSARTLSQRLTKLVEYNANLSTGSLLTAGVSLNLGIRKPGEKSFSDSGKTCSYRTFPDGEPDGERTQSYKPATYAVSDPPWVDTAGIAGGNESLRFIRGGAGGFGHSITISRTIKNPPSSGTHESRITLTLSICPRGGRNAQSC